MTTQLRYENNDEDEREEHNLFTNRSTMMANFEEWIKMATDNKINSRNSWNFALIDYFYDLDVLKDGENNINFQKASATLDGCIKIYSSRVDSVTTETGKLLSGLAQRKANESANGSNGTDGNGQGLEDDDDEEANVQIDPLTGMPISNDPDANNTRRRVYNRVLETTLVEFETIKMKELDQELSIDPLFKKALVDFDEGGAKSLLLNTLNIDNTARVIFDASIKDNQQTTQDEAIQDQSQEDDPIEANSVVDSENEPSQSLVSSCNDSMLNISVANAPSMEDEILSLGMDFIKFDQIAVCEISGSIEQLRNVVEDINQAKGFIENVNNKFDNFLTEEELQEAVPDNAEDGIDGFDMGIQQELEYPDDNHDNTPQDEEGDQDDEKNNTVEGIFEKDLMTYFDENLNRNWRGREHWKVRNFKKMNQVSKGADLLAKTPAPAGDATNQNTENDKPTDAKKKSKQKKALEIDFFQKDDGFEDKIFGPKGRAKIDMPIKNRKNDSHYLLPDDFHFSTDKITRLFIKPGQKMSLFQHKRHPSGDTSSRALDKSTSSANAANNDAPTIADEHFWANNYERIEQEQKEIENSKEVGDVVGGTLDNPFEDDMDGIDFNQAFEGADDNEEASVKLDLQDDEEHKFPIRDNKVTYSRVSKKVDVRRLKKNVWKSINSLIQEQDAKKEDTLPKEDDEDEAPKTDEPLEEDEPPKADEALREGESSKEDEPRKELKFSEIIQGISKMYSDETLKDISTSFCFICLLHLANEHGLQIISTDNYDDLIVNYEDLVTVQTASSK
ncbi:hypothetical protein SUVZ_02G0210 [Saccharomyces uvarum]|uniref:Condensin complex subunit 2 n=1 Tax=Saccharomyces uvarum TaxID=230603 RepID=A0ABN8WMT2_SACUV|nr:hypothetical protein SUVZ_02G0210 [Saccharomyces uvarum]